jgi:hypothetical protein
MATMAMHGKGGHYSDPGRTSSRRAVIAQRGKWVAGLIFLTAFYYLSFRYPLQYGDVRTSGTYTNTPVAFQIAKYAILGLLLPLACIRLRDGKARLVEVLILIFSVLTILQCALIATEDFATATRLFEIGFMLFFVLPFTNPLNVGSLAPRFFTALRLFFWFNIVALAIQLVLYWQYQRLPSLAWEGSSTRFGGIWDDPNSALAPFALWLPYAFVVGRRWLNRIALVVLALVVIVLSQSLTSLAAILLAVPVVFMFFSYRMALDTKVKILVSAGVFSFLFVVVTLVMMWATRFSLGEFLGSIENDISMKQESAMMRLDSYALLGEMDWLSWVGLSPVYGAGENQFINILVNFGLPMLILFVVIHLLILMELNRWTRVARSREELAIATACSVYFIWYFTAMVNLPTSEVFPVNILAAICGGLAVGANRIPRQRGTGEPSRVFRRRHQLSHATMSRW